MTNKLAPFLLMVALAWIGGIATTLIWLSFTTDKLLDPVDAYCHGVLESLVIFGAPYVVTVQECQAFVLNFDFEENDLIGPMVP